MKKKLSLKKLNYEVKKNPQNAEVLRQRAIYFLDSRLKDMDLAKKDIDKAIKLEPNAVFNNILLSYYHINNKNYKKALQFANKACKIEPENMTNFYFRGFCFENLGQFKKAIDDYSLVGPDSTFYSDALKNRANCYNRINSYKEELDDLFKAISITYKYGLTSGIMKNHWQALLMSVPPSAMLDFMEGYCSDQSEEQAINYYTSAIEKDDKQALYFVFRGRAYQRRDEEEKALEDFNRAIDLQNSAIIFSFRAEALSQFGHFESALDDWKAAISRDPDLEYYLGYAETCMSIAKKEDSAEDWIEKAYKSYKTVLRLDPEHPLALVRLADICELKGNQDQAKRYYKEADRYAEPLVSLEDEDFIRLYDRLTVYYPNEVSYYQAAAFAAKMLSDDYDKAISCYSKSIQLDPKNVEHYLNLADIYMHQKQYIQTIKCAEMALELDSQSINSLKYCAVCYMKLEQYEKALNYIELLEAMEKSSFILDASYCKFKIGDEFSSIMHLLNLPADAVFTSPWRDASHIFIRFNYLYSSLYEFRLDGNEADILDFISAILEDSSIGYFAAVISYLFMIQKSDIAPDKFMTVAQMLSDDTVAEIVDQKELDILDSLMEYYIDYQESWNNVQRRDGAKLFNIRTKMALLDYLIQIASTARNRPDLDQQHVGNITRSFQNIRRDLFRLEKAELERIHAHELAESRIRERNKIIADLSHSIKNMISTIIDPLENLKNEKTLQPQVLENALRGANLIREIVNAMNLSFKGSIEDFIYDAQNANGATAVTLQEMLRQSVVYSIINMFDGKYFNIFMRQYFSDKDLFISAKAAWENVSHSPDLQQFVPFLKEFFFACEFNVDLSGELAIGNDKGSAIKLLILFQEIVLNAVKYCSFVPKLKRSIKIDLQESEEKILFTVENSFREDIVAKTTGIGHILIDNFASLLNATSKVVKNEEKYKVEISFPNLWKEPTL